MRELADQRDAVILAHNYQVRAIQDVAHHVGDSLALSRIAATAPQSTIVFCGVHFMAETAKILSPDKTVLIPDADAGCSLADSLTADQLRDWKAANPGAVVVSYVNTTAEVKAETDICCTSSNAVEVVRSIPADTPVLFGPDQFLGAHVRRILGRDNIAGLGRRVPRARRHQRRPADRAGGRAPGRRPVHPPRVRLRDQRAVPGHGGCGAGRAGEDPVHRRHGRRGPGRPGPSRCWWPPRSACSTSCAGRAGRRVPRRQRPRVAAST